MTALRLSSIYLAALAGVLGTVLVLGATRALAARGETGVFLLGLTAGMGTWAWGLHLVAAATLIGRMATALDLIAGSGLSEPNEQGGTK
jgi:hypothetical protein